ncbi:MAG: response regulator [Candidatus Zixiibacteriota bacterium]
MNNPNQEHNAPPDAADTNRNSPIATILLVDDEEMITRLHQRQFEKWGYETIACNTITAALAVVDTDKPIDLVITDYIMPQMKGTDFAAIVHQKRPNTPIILSTGNDLPVPKDDLVNLGVVAMLHKPMQAATLHEVIRTALARTSP